MDESTVIRIKNIISRTSSIKYAFLFGSVLDTLLPDSDVDILIGAALNNTQRIDLAAELETAIKRKFDVVIAQDAKCEVFLKALGKGKSLIIRDREQLKRDYMNAFYRYEDAKVLRMLKTRRMKEKYGHG